MTKYLIITLSCFFLTLSALAQEKKLSKSKTLSILEDISYHIRRKEYDQAEDKAKRALNFGYEGYKHLIYSRYAELKVYINDIPGSREYFNLALKNSPTKFPYDVHYVRLRSYYLHSNPNEIFNAANDWFDNIVESGKPPKQHTTWQFLIDEYLESALLLNRRDALVKIEEKSKQLESGKWVSDLASVYVALIDNNYDHAIHLANQIANNGLGFMNSKLYGKDYLLRIYLHIGDVQKAEESIEILKKNLFVKEGYFEEARAEIALHKKDYLTTIDYTKKLFKGSKGLLWVRWDVSNQYKLYYFQAKAYEGLNNYSEAKRNYEASLTYYPGYSLAEEGLANLITKMEENRAIDQTPPTIEITTPALQRGLEIVTAKTEIMIKGIAKDDSGIQSVSIDGKTIYSKETGEFWGNYIPQADIDSVKITAIDLAGNTADKWLVINSSKTESIIQTAKTTTPQGKNYCLLIASQNYEDTSIPSLEKPIGDAIKLKLILKRKYNFQDDNIFTSFNPSQNDLKKVFTMLSEEIGENDNLVIFYAGHGIWSEQDKKGYWLLADARYADKNTWFPNKSMLSLIGDISSRNTLLITDACFSGSVFRTRGINKENTVAEILSNKIARVAITSGNDSEVPDESVFMRYLIQALENNNEKSLSSQKMFVNHIIEAVMTESNTEPRYGTLEEAGHIGGDFIFTKN